MIDRILTILATTLLDGCFYLLTTSESSKIKKKREEV